MLMQNGFATSDEEYDNAKQDRLGSISYNTGQIYFFGQDNKIKAYEYWYKAAKYGYKNGQKNLGILCKENPWACK